VGGFFTSSRIGLASRQTYVFKRKCGAEEGIRTPTVLPPPGPEPGASTNSATSAFQGIAQMDDTHLRCKFPRCFAGRSEDGGSKNKILTEAPPPIK
jgi:hypothetical protein